MISNVIATHSFIGEKEKKTIEALLYTPINQHTLIMGKALAGFLPAVILTWVFCLIYSIIANVAGEILFNELIFPNAEWMILLVCIIPAITFFSVVFVVMISLRVKSSKSAQSASLIIVLPIMGSITSQVIGSVLINWQLLFVVFGVLVIMDILIFIVSAKKFNKEKYILSI